MSACITLLPALGRAAPQRHGPMRSPERMYPRSTHQGLIRGPATGLQQSGIASSRQQRRQLVLAARAAAGSGDGGSGGSNNNNNSKGSSSFRRRGVPSRSLEPQPELQAWLEQQQGLPAAAADEHARRLAHVFGSQRAALDGLPATFAFCASQGLSGLQTAQLLDSIAEWSYNKVSSFAATTQHEWLQLEACVAAHAQRQRQAVKKLPTHTSFASLVRSNTTTAGQVLCMPPGHVEAWLTALRQRLSEADIGRLLLRNPMALTNKPGAALAVIAWATDELGVSAAQLSSFLGMGTRLLTVPVSTLQDNLAALRQALQQCGLPPELAEQLARKLPQLLGTGSSTVQAAAAWLQRLLPDAAQLQPLLERYPQLLCATVDKLDRNAAYLQRELGWQPGDNQLAAHVQRYPLPFANLDLEGPEVQARLLLLTGVVGAGRADCLTKWSSYLIQGSLETTAALYMLVQERAPQLLFDSDGALSLSWIINVRRSLTLRGTATKAEVLAFQREWPRSEEGRRLLAALRSGSTEGWPLPGAPPH